MKYDYVFDTFAWVEYFTGTAKGLRVKELLETGNILTASITLGEIAFKYGNEGIPGLDTDLKFINSHSTVIALNSELAIAAGKKKLAMRKETGRDLGLADAIIYTVAAMHNAKTVTGDPDFRKLANVVFLE